MPYARDIHERNTLSMRGRQPPIGALDLPSLSTKRSLSLSLSTRWRSFEYKRTRNQMAEKVDRGRMGQNGSSIEARRTKSFLADIIGFRSSHIRSPVCVNALRENDRGFIIKNVSTIVIPVCWSPVGEYQRERAGYKINVNTGSEPVSIYVVRYFLLYACRIQNPCGRKSVVMCTRKFNRSKLRIKLQFIIYRSRQ